MKDDGFGIIVTKVANFQSPEEEPFNYLEPI